MRRGAWAAVLLAACGSTDQGALEIHAIPPDGVTVASYELYAGVFEPTMEPIRPELHAYHVPTVWWQRDRDRGYDILAADADGKAVFVYGLGGSDDDLESMVVIGYDANDTPVAVGTRLEQTDIPHGEIHRWQLPLSGFEALPRENKTILPMQIGMQQWGADGDKRACVQIDNAPLLDRFSNVKSALISLHNDPDCDNLEDDDPLECAPKDYMGQAPFEGRNRLTCAMKTDAPSLDNPLQPVDVCVAGGGTCVDGRGTDPTACDPSAWCMPLSVCNACSDLATCDPTAVGASNVTHIDCPISSSDNQSTNSEDFCPSPLSVDLRQLTIEGLSCEDTPMLGDHNTPFAASLDFANGGAMFVENVDASTCRFKFQGTGALPSANGTYSARFSAALSVPLLGPVKGRGLILPVVFRVVSFGCLNAPTQCQIIKAPGDALPPCVRAEVVPGTQVIE